MTLRRASIHCRTPSTLCMNDRGRLLPAVLRAIHNTLPSARSKASAAVRRLINVRGKFQPTIFLTLFKRTTQ